MQTQTADMAKTEVFKLRLEPAEREQLDALAALEGVTSAQMVRLLIKRAVDAIDTTYRVSAWDGQTAIGLYWVGSDEDAARAKADDLARRHAKEKKRRWTVFRVYRNDQREPIYRALVGQPTAKKSRK